MGEMLVRPGQTGEFAAQKGAGIHGKFLGMWGEMVDFNATWLSEGSARSKDDFQSEGKNINHSNTSASGSAAGAELTTEE